MSSDTKTTRADDQGSELAPIFPKGRDPKKMSDHELLTSCVHCGFCLEVCPTYQMSGDENNSPRGRLRLWRAEEEGRISPDVAIDFYTEQCVGCLACESACPANVPYGEILERTRHQHVEGGRLKPLWRIRMANHLVRRPKLFQTVAAPLRWLRQRGLSPHRFLFPGHSKVLLSTADYAQQLMQQHQPSGPRVALLTGCLMEAVFREVNFATVRLLIQNNYQVVVPSGQTCCGAFQAHAGLPGVEQLEQQNRTAFATDVETIVTNSSGCGHALGKALEDRPVQDVLVFLGQRGIQPRPRQTSQARIYVDQPCHLLYGQKEAGIPENVLDAIGLPWQWAPRARDCCGSGGTYNIQRPAESQAILAGKSEFLNSAEGDPVILATSNHVCMMQWHSAGRMGLVQRPYQVRHIVQLLAPEEVG